MEIFGRKLVVKTHSHGPSTSAEKDWPDDDEALLELCPDGKTKLPENYWCLKDAFEGVQIFGGTGSGKSSGSGQAIARAFLEANLGGLVLTAKTDEVLTWKNYAKETGREGDLLVFEPGGKYQFNFLQYELKRPGSGAGHTESLVNLFCSVLEAAERKQQGGGNDAYWQRTMKQLLRNAIDLAILAADEVNLPALYKIITSAPRSSAEALDPEWRKNSVCYALIEEAEPRAKEKQRENDFDLTREYWLREFPGLADETRSIIVSTFTSMADCFLRGLLRKLFCGELTITPEDSFKGKIILLNLPVKEYNELGQFAQVLFKYMWQRAVERRIPPGLDRAKAREEIRPVFLYADESQFFANSYDSLFQSTARSSRASTVYLTQNLPSYLSAFGGPNSRSDAEAFLGNLQTKIFHANGDPSTNNWGADSIGKTKQLQTSGGISEGLRNLNGAANLSQNAGGSMVFQFLIQPQEFTVLKTGGPDANLQVEAIIFQGGRNWVIRDGGTDRDQNYIRHKFPQKYEHKASSTK
ncbi:MAG TPA: TraM recognition domain-containing protein [Verrucomicrobiae bacterium]|nr:TraM recognition domain-containing protein [Verrucomicrobiae bacterium]